MTKAQIYNKRIHDHSGNKYVRQIHSVNREATETFQIDVYCVLKAFAVVCPAIQHAIKKLLCCGLRNKNSKLDDLHESIDAILRAIDMESQEQACYPLKGKGTFASSLNLSTLNEKTKEAVKKELEAFTRKIRENAGQPSKDENSKESNKEKSKNMRLTPGEDERVTFQESNLIICVCGEAFPISAIFCPGCKRSINEIQELKSKEI